MICRLLCAAALLFVAACSSAPKAPVASASSPATTGWEGRERVGDAIALLNKGEAEKARKLLARVVARQPGDAVAASLIRQIDTPAETLLGRQSFGYTARANDSFSALAARYLGDPMMFYALARYNGVSAAGMLTPGTKLRIPGREPRREATPAPKVDRPTPAPAPAPIAKPAPAPRATDPAAAVRLRAAALEQLNRGQIDRAVQLLNRAAQLDPGNTLVRRDLDRAVRIRRTVKAKP